MNKQITKKCHIVWRNYMKGFTNQDGYLFRHDFRANKIIKQKPEKFGYEKNLFNYFDQETEKYVDDLEKSMGSNEESQYGERLEKTKKEIQETGRLSEKTMHSSRKTIFEMYQFTKYKVIFQYITQYLKIPEQKTKKQRDVVNILAKRIAQQTTPDKTTKNHERDMKKTLQREWIFCYLEEPIITFGDYPFHLRPNQKNNSNDGNNLITFLTRKGSNIYFPINKNLFVMIQHNETQRNIFYKINKEDLKKEQEKVNLCRAIKKVYPETHLEIISDRIRANSKKYIAGYARETIEEIIIRPKNELYLADPNRFVWENQLKKYMETIKREMETIKREIEQRDNIEISSEEIRKYTYETLKNMH